jgi:hypothetical protein
MAPPWWRIGGCDERGAYGLEIIDPRSDPPLPAAEHQALDEIKRRLDLIRAALRDGAVILVDIEGRVIPRQVWLDGGWKFDRSAARGVEWLEADRKYYGPRFAAPAAIDDDGKRVPAKEAKNVLAQAEGGGGTKKKAKATPIAAEMIAWLDALPAKQRRNRTPNALADRYLSDPSPSRRGSKRYACTVFANPDKYRGRSSG